MIFQVTVYTHQHVFQEAPAVGMVVLASLSWRRDLDLSSDVCHVNRVLMKSAAWCKT